MLCCQIVQCVYMGVCALSISDLFKKQRMVVNGFGFSSVMLHVILGKLHETAKDYNIYYEP